MTSYRAPFPYRERQGSWEELDCMPQRRDFDDYYYGHSRASYRDDSGHPLYDDDEGYLEDERRKYIDYRDGNPDLRERDDEYRRFERESRRPPPPPLLRDFRRNEESSRDLDPETSRESRFFDSLDEYIREQRKLNHADVNREKQRGPRSPLHLESIIVNDDRSRDHSDGGGYRSRGYLAEERSRDRDYRSRHNDDDYHRSDYNDDYGCRRYERRSRMKEPDYHGKVDPRYHGYHRDHARSDPYYQRDDRNDYDKRSEEILYGYRDRHRRYTERELRKQMDEYDSHGRANSPERERGRRGREFSFVDRDKHSYSSSSRLLEDERTTRPGMRSYDDEPQRRTEREEPRCKRERRLSREDYQRANRHSQRQRSGRLSRSPGIPVKAHSRSSSPARKSPLSSGKAQTHDKNPKRKMPIYELNETKKRKCDGRQTREVLPGQTNTSLKSETPKAGLITRDQFLSRDVFNSIKHSNREPEGKRTRSSDIEFRDSNLSRSSCGERDLRHELSVSRAAAASEAKSLHFGDYSDYEERSSTASSTRIIDNEPSAIRSIVQIPTKTFQDLHESRTKIKEEVEIHSTQIRITPDPVIKTRIEQVSTLSNAEPLPVTTGQSVRTSEVLKRKVSICSGRATSPLLGVAEKPKVELPADDLRLLIMSRRLRQNEEPPSLDENLVEKTEEPLMSSPRTDHQCQVSSERQGSTDRMVELSYSDPDYSANEDSAPLAPTGHACRKVVMRREVILDYGHGHSHPKTLHRSLDKDKEKEKLDNEKESSGNSNVVVEVVSEGVANPPVCTNRPLFKEGDENLSTVEVVDNPFESLDGSHAANDSQRSEDSTRDVNSYVVEESSYGSAIADAANSTAVYEEESNYPQQTEESVSDQQILDYDSSVDKCQETKVDGVQESECLKEENNGVWMGSSELCENEQQIWPHEEKSYQDLGHFQKENDASGENSPEHYQEEQHSGSNLEQECYQKWHNTETSDVVRENTAESYEEEQQSVSHYDQEYSQELGYDAEENNVVTQNPSEYYEEEQKSVSHYEQEYSQELGYDGEENDVVRENPSEYYEDEVQLSVSHYEQEYSQELGYDGEESDIVRDNPSEHHEEQPLSHYDQEYSQELGYGAEENDVVRENPSEHHEEQPLFHYDQEYSQEHGYDAEENDVVRENPSEHYEEQPLSHYDQENSQELGHYTEESDVVRQNTAEHHEEEQPLSHHEQACSQELGHFQDESDVVRENPSESYEGEQHIPSYEQQSYQELGHYTEESDVVRENTPEHYEDEQQVSHYEQECYQKLEHLRQESDDVREDPSQHYEEEQSVLHYDEEHPQELEHYTKESDVVRDNTSEHYEEDHPLTYDEQLSYRELGHYTNESDVVRENTLENHEEDQPVLHHDQQSYRELGQASSQEIEYLPEDGANNMRKNCSEYHQEDQPVFRSEAEFSQKVDHLQENTTGEERERSSEPHKDEQQDSKQEYFQEFEQFAGTSDDANDHESLSEPSEQESESSEYEEETTSQNGEEDESFSSEGESYQSTTDEDNYYKVNDFGVVHFTEKQHELSDSSERQYAYYGDSMSEAAFSEVKPSCSSEYTPVTNSHQYKPESSKNVEEYEYYDDFEEDTPEMSNGYDVILALDSFDNDEADDDIKYAENSDFDNGGIFRQDGIDGTRYLQGGREMTEVHGFSYKMDAPKLPSSDDDKHDVIGTPITEIEDKGRVAQNNEHTKNIGRAELTHIIGTQDQSYQNSEAGNEATTINYDRSSCECVKKISPEEDVPAIGTEDFYHTVGQPIKDFDENEKCQGSDECEIRHYDLSRPPCNNGENEAQKLKHYDLNRSSGSEYDLALLTKDYGIMNEKNSCSQSNNDELQEPNTSSDLLNRTSGSEYDPARPTKDHGIMDEQNSCCHSNNDELQEPNTSSDLLNRTSGSEYDPARPTKDHGIMDEQNSCCHSNNDDLQEPNTSADLLNKTSGSEYDPARPTKDHSPIIFNKSSGSEYDPYLPTKDYGIISAQTSYDDVEGMQQSIHSEDILNTISGAEYDLSLPKKDYGIIRAQTRYDDADEEEEEEEEQEQEQEQEEADDDHHEGMQQSSHLTDVLNKSSGSEYDPSLPTKEYVRSSEVSHVSDDILELRHLDLNKSSGSEFEIDVTKARDVTNEQDYYNDDVVQNLRYPNVNKSSVTETDVPTKDCEVTFEQDNHSDDVIQDLRSPDLNKSSVSEYDPHIPTRDRDVTFEQDNHSDDVIQDLRSPDLNKSSVSEYDPHIPTRDRDVTFEQDNHSDDVIQDLRSPNLNKSSVSEYDPHIPTRDRDVTFEQDNHSDDVIQDLRSPDLNKSSVSEYDPHTPTRDRDVTFEQDNHSDDVIQDLRSPDLNKSSVSEYDPHIPTRDCDVTFEQDNHSDDVIQDLRSPDLSSSCGSETDVPIQTKSCDVINEQKRYDEDVIQELRHSNLNESNVNIGCGHDPHLQSRGSHDISDVKKSTEDAGSTGTIAEKKECYNGGQSLPESDEMLVDYEASGTQESIIVMCDNDATSGNAQPSYEMANQEEYQVLGAATEIFLPLDVNANHICIYECVDFQLQRVLCPTSITGDQGTAHNLEADVNGCQEDLTTAYITSAKSERATNSAVAAPILREECVIEERRVVQNQVNLICSPISDEDQACLQEERSCTRLNVAQATSKAQVRQGNMTQQSVPESECNLVEHGDPDEKENFEGIYIIEITVMPNNVGMSDKSCASAGIPLIETTTENNEKETTQDLDTDNDATRVDQGSFERMAASIGSSEKKAPEEMCRESGSFCSSALVENTQKNRGFHDIEIKLESPDDPDLMYVDEVQYFEGEQPVGKSEYTGSSESSNQSISSGENMVSDDDTCNKESCDSSDYGTRGRHWYSSDTSLSEDDWNTSKNTKISDTSKFVCPVEDQQTKTFAENGRENMVSDHDICNKESCDSSDYGTGGKHWYSSDTSLSEDDWNTSKNTKISDTSKFVCPVEDQQTKTVAENGRENMVSDHDICNKESCDSSDYGTGGKHWYSSDTSLSEDDWNTSKNTNISDTRKFVCPVEDQQTKTVAENGRMCINISDISDNTVNEEHDELIPSQEAFESISSELSDSVGVSSPRLGVQYCKKKSPRQRQSEMMLNLREEFRRCSQNDGQQGCVLVSSSSETSYSVLSDSHDTVLQAKPYDPECASLTQVSISDVSIETPSTSSAHAVCVTEQQDLSSDMSLESSSQTSPRCSQVSCVTLKTQTAISTLRASFNQPSPSASPSTRLVVPNELEDSDLKSRKPYDPANCPMDVDTFSELSGMSLDTPSSSTVEYTVTEADNTLVGLADDDSEPYTPEAYSRSPENDSEPYTPEAYSPVLLLSGDESDPELFSCKYMDNSSAPYNPESHCPVDLNMSSISGNEADNEVSTGVSSPEFSSNRKIPLSLRLKKKPGSKKVYLKSYIGYSSLNKESSNDDAWQKNPEAYSPESFVPQSKPAAARKNSSRKSLRVHSRSKCGDVERRKRVNTTTKNKECSVENKKPHASQKSLPSSSEKSETTCGKECKSREGHTTGSKRKPLKSLITVATPCTNKRAKEDEGRKKMHHHTSTRMKEKSGTKDHKSIPKEKESVKRRVVSETNEAETAQDKSTPPLKKPKLSSQSSKKRSLPESSGTGASHQNKNMPSARRNSKEEKFKKPLNPARCRTETGKKSSERTKQSSQKKTVRNGSAAKRKVQGGASASDGSFTMLNELRSIMKDIHRKSPKSPNKSPESGTKNREKVEETVDEHYLLDEGHELLELALEESINRTKSDKATRVSSSDNDKDSAKPGSHGKEKNLNLAEKIDKMKRKLAEMKGISGNENTNLAKGLKPSELQETRADITISNDLDNSADDKGSKNAVKAKNEEILDTLKANQTSTVRSINDKFESIKLAVKCNGDGKDVINSSVVTGSKINNKDLGIENTMGVAPHEKKNEDKNVNPDDDGKITIVDNGVAANENVVSSAIEKQEGSKTEMDSDIELCPTGVQEAIDETEEVNIVRSGTDMQKNEQDAQGSDEENRSSTSGNLDTRRSVETGESYQVSSVIENLKGDENLECIIEDAVTKPLTNETTSESFNVSPMESTINEEKNREKENNICKEDGQETPGEDTCKSDLEVTNTLSPAYSVILSLTMKAHGQDKYSHEVRGQDSKMSGGQLPEDKTGKTVISDSGAGENDHLSKDQDGQPNKERKGNENDEFDQDKNNWPKDTQPNKEKQGAERNEFDQKKIDWSTIKGNVESNSYTATAFEKASATKVQTRASSLAKPSGVPCTQVVQTAANDSSTPSGKASTPMVVQIRASSPPKPSGIPCTQVVQTAANESATPSGKVSTRKVVQTRANGPPTPNGVPCTQMDQTAANESATPPEKVSTPKAVQIRANGPPAPSGVPCTQLVQTAANDSVISGGTLYTSKNQAGANNSDTKNSESKEEDEDSREAVSSILAEPMKNQEDSKAEDSKASDVAVISSGQPKEQGKDVKSEISLEEYIEAQLQQGLSLPDISVNSGVSSKVSSEILPSLPSLSFINPAAAPGASKSSSLSTLKVPLVAVSSSSAMESQKKQLSPTTSSNAERETCMLSSDVSKEIPLVNESKCQVPSRREEGSSKQENSGMDIVRNLRAQYERKIIAILQKRVDVEKAYREECTSIVNAVKALARKKKNMERELKEVLQSSLREISQKYVSELQRFVRNETI